MPIFLGIKGTVIALDRATGAMLWQLPLKSTMFVTLALDGDVLLASTRGEVWCIDPMSGRVLWHNALPGFGWGLVTFATADPGQQLNQQVAAAEELHRQQQQAAGAAAAASASAAS
jgi:hypothetical protein